MNVLSLFTFEDRSYYHRLPRICPRLKFMNLNTNPKTAGDLTLLANRYQSAAIVTTNVEILTLVLEATPDFVKTSKKITIDNYAGSMLRTPNLGPITGVDLLVLPPLSTLVTHGAGEMIIQHYLRKIWNPEHFGPKYKLDWQLIDSVADAKIALAAVESARLVSIDIENNIKTKERELTCCGFSVLSQDLDIKTYVLPLREYWQFEFLTLLCATSSPKTLQNGLYDTTHLCRWNAPIVNWRFDTLILFHSWYSELPRSLDYIAAFCIRDVRYWKDESSTGSLEDHYRYNAQDCHNTLLATLYLLREMPEWALTNFLITFPKVFPSLQCALEGIATDLTKLESVKAEALKLWDQQLEEIRFILGEPEFNPNSPVQMKALFKLLGLGHYETTDAAAMLKAKSLHPFNEFILDKIISCKKNRKLISTYYEEEKFKWGRCFYSLNPAGTDTGRMASRESAYWCGLQIQNIPRGDAVKQLMHADDGWSLAEIDKAQAEARCVGYLAGEASLIELVESDKDYHAWNASAFFGVPYEDIWDVQKNKTKNKALRDLAKRVNHGSNYSMGAAVMVQTMGPKMMIDARNMLGLPSNWMPERVAAHLLEVYASTYPKIKGLWYERIKQTIRESGKLTSALGFTRRFFGRPWESKPALNAAVAHGPQNLSVAIINEEYYNIWRVALYGSYYRPNDYQKFYSFKPQEVTPVAEIKLPILVGNVRQKAQIHDSHFLQYRTELESEIIPAIMSMLDTKIKILGADGVERTMFIPSDSSYGGKYWSDIK